MNASDNCVISLALSRSIGRKNSINLVCTLITSAIPMSVSILRIAADRPANQRPAAFLRPALPHPHRPTRRSGNLSRPSRLLAVGTRHGQPDSNAHHSARPDRDGHRQCRRRCENLHRNRKTRRECERHFFQSVFEKCIFKLLLNHYYTL